MAFCAITTTTTTNAIDTRVDLRYFLVDANKTLFVQHALPGDDNPREEDSCS